MGLVFNGSLLADAHLWLWRIEEEESFFLDKLNLSAADQLLLATFSATSRRLEWLASRFVLQQAFGNEVYISYNAENKPMLNGVLGHISISHSHQMVGVLYHPVFSVGLDVERVSARPTKVIHRFLDDNEQLLVAKDDACEAITRAWCSKEALFKLMGQHCFTLKDDFKLTTALQPSSDEAVFFLKPLGVPQQVFFHKVDDYIVALTINQNSKH
ncbi:4'-phosphopantetheinyl transferase family protein [Williamwhitmania taraxaci]|uniref:Phosphopantetheinyl transferase n=1 Tax=Williamwhitmania taraxaci TaxID=1640674 RepID=A0A1G6HDE8_9BACT|nr:4'-phosphopantetheinyl transferase superfamily protein [Williamwhitmania taraxaci]SDB92118.1 Phosphopantetheinyl transferase [Williamwhitmania taraxaci]